MRYVCWIPKLKEAEPEPDVGWDADTPLAAAIEEYSNYLSHKGEKFTWQDRIAVIRVKCLATGAVTNHHLAYDSKANTISAAIPVIRERAGFIPLVDLEACCFCWERTPMWTALPDRTPGQQVACCETCAAAHEPAAVPSKRDWFRADCAREIERRTS